MSLSYNFRLVCVLVIFAGLTQFAAQFALALGIRSISRRLEYATARQRERILYLFQVGPALLSGFVALALCLPAYICSEPNREIESVSVVCLLMAAGTGMWFAFAVLRGLRVTLRTVRFTRACRRSGQYTRHAGSLPVLRVPYCSLPVALFGFLRPVIIVSAEFADGSDRLDPDALALALAHEHAHAAHYDNWKLLALAFLPRLGQILPGGDRLFDLWQTAADWAADNDAVQGDPTRSLLLAEALVRAARCAYGQRPFAVCTALTSAEAALRARVDRLMHPQCDLRPDRSRVLPFLALLVLLAAAAFAFSPWIYTLSERLLHLGAA
jgi:hypothetical protein